jgi:hypothetical protein
MSEKKEVLNITEAYKKIVINELGGSTPGDGVSTVPAPQHSSVVAIKNEEENICGVSNDSYLCLTFLIRFSVNIANSFN